VKDKASVQDVVSCALQLVRQVYLGSSAASYVIEKQKTAKSFRCDLQNILFFLLFYYTDMCDFFCNVFCLEQMMIACVPSGR
jgi:hypothetical protein